MVNMTWRFLRVHCWITFLLLFQMASVAANELKASVKKASSFRTLVHALKTQHAIELGPNLCSQGFHVLTAGQRVISRFCNKYALTGA